MRLTAALCLVLIGCQEYTVVPEPGSSEPAVDTTAPDILVTPDAIDFGLLEEDATATTVLTVSNVGSNLLGIDRVYLSDDSAPFSLTAISSSLLSPGDLAELSVTVYAREPGGITAELLIDSTDPDTPRVSVPLTAEVSGDPDTAVDEECDCPEGFTPLSDQDGCFRETEEEPTWEGVVVYACAITPYIAYGKYGAMYPGGTSVQDAYWGEDNTISNGPLNRVGIWGCGKGDTIAGSNPTGEWIGFRVCLDVKEDADYLLGAGADNRFRMFIDEEPLFEHNEGSTAAFNYWWLTPISLEAGQHIVDLYGKNDGSIAGFAAEIAGPFPSGTASASDEELMKLDYSGSLIWSTRDVIGQAFSLGTDTSWSCPDGTTFDVCDEEPICIVYEETECE